MKAAVDIAKLPEDDRIKFIGELVLTGESAWCLTDDIPGKIERYRRKMAIWFPMLKLGEIKRDFPMVGCGGFSVYPPDPQRN